MDDKNLKLSIDALDNILNTINNKYENDNIEYLIEELESIDNSSNQTIE